MRLPGIWRNKLDRFLDLALISHRGRHTPTRQGTFSIPSFSRSSMTIFCRESRA
jgi:hypothetical protein